MCFCSYTFLFYIFLLVSYLLTWGQVLGGFPQQLPKYNSPRSLSRFLNIPLKLYCMQYSGKKVFILNFLRSFSKCVNNAIISKASCLRCIMSHCCQSYTFYDSYTKSVLPNSSLDLLNVNISRKFNILIQHSHFKVRNSEIHRNYLMRRRPHIQYM